MKYVYSSFLALLGVIDFVYFVQYCSVPATALNFIIIHLSIGLISFILAAPVPNRYRIYPYFLFWAMPGFGPLAFGLIQFSVIYMEYNQTLIFEYEKYLYYEKVLDIKSQTTFTSDVQTISLQDRFLYSQHDTKKDMISSMLSGEESDYSYLLKDSLDDDDMEVTHYAATALNAFENEFEKIINQTRKAYLANRSAQNLVLYIDAMEKYLDSRLPDYEVEKILRTDYIYLLKEHLKIDPTSRSSHLKLLTSLMQLEKYADLLDELREYMLLYPNDPEGHLLIMKYLYKNNRKDKLSKYTESIDRRYAELPKKMNAYVKFWSQKGAV